MHILFGFFIFGQLYLCYTSSIFFFPSHQNFRFGWFLIFTYWLASIGLTKYCQLSWLLGQFSPFLFQITSPIFLLFFSPRTLSPLGTIDEWMNMFCEALLVNYVRAAVSNIWFAGYVGQPVCSNSSSARCKQSQFCHGSDHHLL